MVLKNLLGTTAAVTVSAIVGAIASADTKSLWYRTLRKPDFQPPAIAFPVMWTALHADIAGTSAVVLDRLEDDAEKRRRFRVSLGTNLALNSAWTWVFFRSHKLGPAVAVAGVLTLSTLDLVRQAGAVRRSAGWALIPYALWCGFATVLSAAIWYRNPAKK